MISRAPAGSLRRQRDVVDANRLKVFNPLDNLRSRSDQAALQHLREDKPLLARLEIDHVPLVNIEVEPVLGRPLGGRVLADVAVILAGEVGVVHAQVGAGTVRRLPHRVDPRNHAWSEDPGHALGSERLAVLQHQTGGQADGVRLLCGATGSLCGGGDHGEALLGVEAHAGRDPAVADLPDHLHRPRTVGGHVDRDEIVEVEELRVLPMDQADPALLPGDVVGVEHILAIEQSAHLLRILEVALDWIGGQAHGVAPGVSRADAEDDPARRQLVQRRHRRGRHRRNPVGRNRNQGAQFDRRRVMRGQRHRRIDVGVDQLRVIEPGVSESGRLGPLDLLVRIDPTRDANAVMHVGFLSSTSAADTSGASSTDR